MRELSLFTGMGGGIYGSLILGWKTVAYVERDEYCQKVIKQRIADGWFDPGEVYGDIKEFNKNDANKYTGKIDILTGGFPCQPFSVAGKRKGTSDERYLFDEIIKTIKIVQPRQMLFENVPGLLNSPAIIEIYESLIKLGYIVNPPLVLGSNDCGNIHQRKRVWVFAYAPEQLCYGARHEFAENTNFYDTDHRCERVQRSVQEQIPQQYRISRRESIGGLADIIDRPDIPTPLFCGVDDELSHWRKQLKAIGNGQDPIVMATAYKILTEQC